MPCAVRLMPRYLSSVASLKRWDGNRVHFLVISRVHLFLLIFCPELLNTYELAVQLHFGVVCWMRGRVLCHLRVHEIKCCVLLMHTVEVGGREQRGVRRWGRLI